MSSWLSSTKEKLSAKARLPSSVQMKAPLPGTTTPASADQNSSFVRIRAESSGRLPKTSLQEAGSACIEIGPKMPLFMMEPRQ